jgi:hypothetical protein
MPLPPFIPSAPVIPYTPGSEDYTFALSLVKDSGIRKLPARQPLSQTSLEYAVHAYEASPLEDIGGKMTLAAP